LLSTAKAKSLRPGSISLYVQSIAIVCPAVPVKVVLIALPLVALPPKASRPPAGIPKKLSTWLSVAPFPLFKNA
jgi:hypothetical protein